MTPGGTNKPRAVLLCAIPVEYAAIRRHLTSLAAWGDPNVVNWEQGSFAGKHAEWDVLVANTGAENGPAGIETTRALAGFRPQVAIYVGIAGGLAEKGVKAGEVVTPSRVYFYGVVKEADVAVASWSIPIVGPISSLFGHVLGRERVRNLLGRVVHDRLPTTAQRPRGGSVDRRLFKAAERAERSGAWKSRIPEDKTVGRAKVRFEPMGSGDVLLKSVYSKVYKLLRTQSEDAVAIDMESGGFLLAAEGHDGVRALVVRGISDLCTDKTPEDDATRQPVAAERAAAFAYEVLNEVHPDQQSGAAPSPVLDLAAELELVAEVERWYLITEGLFSSTASIAMADADRLTNLQAWLAMHVAPHPQGPITGGADNFRRVLDDLQLVLHYLMEIRNDHYFVVQWYRNYYGRAGETREVDNFMAHSYLISRLAGEATMALNLVLDRGRAVDDGRVGLPAATALAGGGDAPVPLRYSEERAQLLQPYPGLDLFVEALAAEEGLGAAGVSPEVFLAWARHLDAREGPGSPPPPSPTATI